MADGMDRQSCAKGKRKNRAVLARMCRNKPGGDTAEK